MTEKNNERTSPPDLPEAVVQTQRSFSIVLKRERLRSSTRTLKWVRLELSRWAKTSLTWW